MCGFYKKRKELRGAVTFCGHVSACSLGGSFILGKPETEVSLRGWSQLRWELVGWLWQGLGGLLRGVPFPCEAVVEDLPGFTTTTVWVLFRKCREPHFTPRTPGTPNTTTNSRGMGTVCSAEVSESLSEQFPLAEGVEVVLLDQGKTSSV